MFLMTAFLYTALSVDVVRDALGLAGFPFTLTCIVTLTNVSLSPPDVAWLGPDGRELTNSTQISVYAPVTENVTTLLMLEFLPMLTSHAGKYGCYVELVNEETAFVEESIAVQSKCRVSWNFATYC